jgi:hypothetical protein
MTETCAQCGFDGAVYDSDALVRAVRALAPRWRHLLGSAGPELRQRPSPGVWSAIEYAAHSVDVTALHVWGVEQALSGTEPALPPIDERFLDEVAATYGEADPEQVASALAMETNLLASLAADAGPAVWNRGLTIGDNRMDVRALLEHALHDSEHHLVDVERGLAYLRAG